MKGEKFFPAVRRCIYPILLSLICHWDAGSTEKTDVNVRVRSQIGHYHDHGGYYLKDVPNIPYDKGAMPLTPMTPPQRPRTPPRSQTIRPHNPRVRPGGKKKVRLRNRKRASRRGDIRRNMQSTGRKSPNKVSAKRQSAVGSSKPFPPFDLDQLVQSTESRLTPSKRNEQTLVDASSSPFGIKSVPGNVALPKNNGQKQTLVEKNDASSLSGTLLTAGIKSSPRGDFVRLSKTNAKPSFAAKLVQKDPETSDVQKVNHKSTKTIDLRNVYEFPETIDLQNVQTPVNHKSTKTIDLQKVQTPVNHKSTKTIDLRNVTPAQRIEMTVNLQKVQTPVNYKSTKTFDLQNVTPAQRIEMTVNLQKDGEFLPTVEDYLNLNENLSKNPKSTYSGEKFNLEATFDAIWPMMGMSPRDDRRWTPQWKDVLTQITFKSCKDRASMSKNRRTETEYAIFAIWKYYDPKGTDQERKECEEAINGLIRRHVEIFRLYPQLERTWDKIISAEENDKRSKENDKRLVVAAVRYALFDMLNQRLILDYTISLLSQWSTDISQRDEYQTSPWRTVHKDSSPDAIYTQIAHTGSFEFVPRFPQMWDPPDPKSSSPSPYFFVDAKLRDRIFSRDSPPKSPLNSQHDSNKRDHALQQKRDRLFQEDKYFPGKVETIKKLKQSAEGMLKVYEVVLGELRDPKKKMEEFGQTEKAYYEYLTDGVN